MFLSRLGKLDMLKLTNAIDQQFIRHFEMNLRDAGVYRNHVENAYAKHGDNIDGIVKELAEARGLSFPGEGG